MPINQVPQAQFTNPSKAERRGRILPRRSMLIEPIGIILRRSKSDRSHCEEEEKEEDEEEEEKEKKDFFQSAAANKSRAGKSDEAFFSDAEQLRLISGWAEEITSTPVSFCE